MAAADRIEITIDGKGGHGAHPHAAIDPVLVAGHIITAAQSIVSRNVSPIDTAVVSLCAMHAGHPGAMSVIPVAREAGRDGAHVPPRDPGHDRAAADRARAVDRRRVRRARDAALRARVSGDDQPRPRSDVRGRRRRIAGRPRQRRAQSRSVDGLRGFLVHAGGQARRVRPARPGRGGRRLLPAQQHLRFQRCRHSRSAPGYLAALAEAAMPLRK